MTDIFNKRKRSEIMSLVKSKNTSPERLVFSHLRKRGIYFQRHYARVPGCPDVALPKKKIAIFIDGDFWHGRKFNKRKAKLSFYWSKKNIWKHQARQKESLGFEKNELVGVAGLGN